MDPLVTRLAALDTCCLSDALDSLGLTGSVAGIVAMWEGATVAGRALTVRLAEGPAPTDSPPVHLGARAIDIGGPGDVIVVDNGGRIGMGGWGGLLSVAASVRGIEGVIVDGACRDVDECRQLQFGAFARAPVARTARGRVHEVSCGGPIKLGDVSVDAGDLVRADGSGVVVISAASAESVLDRAAQIAAREVLMQADLRAGKSAREVLGTSYEQMLDEQTIVYDESVDQRRDRREYRS